MKYLLERGFENNFQNIGSFDGEEKLFEAIHDSIQRKFKFVGSMYTYEYIDRYKEYINKDDGYTYIDYGNNKDIFRYKEII
jgi:hypothetical protein